MLIFYTNGTTGKPKVLFIPMIVLTFRSVCMCVLQRDDPTACVCVCVNFIPGAPCNWGWVNYYVTHCFKLSAVESMVSGVLADPAAHCLKVVAICSCIYTCC